MKKKTMFVVLVLLAIVVLAVANDMTSQLVLSRTYQWVDTMGQDDLMFDGSGLDDAIPLRRYTGTADSTFVIEVVWAFPGKTGSAQFDGTGLNDATTKGAYTGTADSVFVIEIMDTSAANGDTIQWGAIDGTDTTGVAWRDTAVMAADSNDLGTGLYIKFAARSGHTIGDRWVIQCYNDWPDSVDWGIVEGTDTSGVSLGNTEGMRADSVALQTGVKIKWTDTIGHTVGDRWVLYATTDQHDTITSSEFKIPYSNIQWYTEITFPTATGDSTITQLLNSFHAGGTFRIVAVDTSTATDTNLSYFVMDSNSYYGEYWKVRHIIAGQEPDTESYTIYSKLIGF